MTERKNEAQESHTESRWDRAFQEVESSRSSGSKPDETQFKDLTKSAGGN